MKKVFPPFQFMSNHQTDFNIPHRHPNGIQFNMVILFTKRGKMYNPIWFNLVQPYLVLLNPRITVTNPKVGTDEVNFTSQTHS